MRCYICKTVVAIFLSFFVFVSLATATTYFMANNPSSGNAGWGNGSNSNNGERATPFLTLEYAFSQMNGRDELVIDDGTYTGSENIIDNGVPNGATISNFAPGAGAGCTTIRADNDYGATLDGELKRSMMNFTSRHNVKIQGIRFIRGSNTGVSINGGTSSESSYITLSKSAVHAVATNTYGINIRVTSHADNYSAYQPHHILIEDVHAWGDCRYQGYFHYAHHNIVRRTVLRWDAGSGTIDDPVAGWAFYSAKDCSAENVIVIDSDENPCWAGGSCSYQGIYITEHGPYAQDDIQVYGSLVLNTHGYSLRADPNKTHTGTNFIKQTVLWGKDETGEWNLYLNSRFRGTVENVTAGDNPDNGHSSGYSGGIDAAASNVNHSLIYDQKGFGIRRASSVGDNNAYDVCMDSNGKPCETYGSSGSDPGIEQDPQIKYIVDASITEVGGASGSGSAPKDDGAQIGAVLQKRYVNGVLTDTDLWPWENEDQIKADFQLYSRGNTDPDRGFCAPGKQLNGTDNITLTSYIWEYLGNQMPSDINDRANENSSSTPTLSISTSSFVEGVTNEEYQAALSSYGGAPPYNWSLESGSLPADLTLSSSGVVSGTPMLDGTETFTVKVTDSNSPASTVTKELSITVAEPPALSINTSSLNNAIVNSSYNGILIAQGGKFPYVWSLESGAFPSGLTFSSSGALSGTPIAEGSYSFVVKVVDSEPSSPSMETKQLTLIVSDVPIDMVGYWSLDDGRGTEALDEVSGGNNLNISGATWISGNSGSALSFDGNNYAYRSDADLVGAFPAKNTGAAKDFTLAAWIFLDKVNTRQPIISKQGHETRGFLFLVEDSNKLFIQVFNNVGAKTEIFSSAVLTTGQWYHVAATYDYEGDGSSSVKLYINGINDGTSNSAIGPVRGNTEAFEFGRYYWSDSYNIYMDGAIDDVKVYERALSAAEIAALMTGEPASGQLPVAPRNLIINLQN